MRNNRIIVFILAIFTIGCNDPEIDITKHEFYPIPDSEIEMAIDSIGTFPEIIPKEKEGPFENLFD